MKKIAFIFLILLAIFSGCKKDEEDQGVQFRIANVADLTQKSVGLKSALTIPPIEEIPCSPYRASYIKVVIDGAEFIADAFYIMEGGDEILYTNTLPIPAGDHEISDFSVWYDNGAGEDILLSATPHEGSGFAQYVAKPLNFRFTSYADRKTYVGIEVVCYDDEHAADFGFIYFGVNEIALHGLNFFGDFCIKKKSDYNGSRYAQQYDWGSAPGEYIDVPAIAKIELWTKVDNGPWTKNDEDFYNSDQGETIKVIYKDSKTKTDSVELKLFIYVKEGANFDYRYFYSWKFKDDEKPLQTADGHGGLTTYYCLGSCTPSANYILPAWVTLASTVTYTIVGNTAPGSLGGYVDAQISGAGAGFEFGDGIYASNCADHTTSIQIGVPYEMDVYSSLYVEEMPVFARKSQWAKINWLINHIGLAGTDNSYPGYTWADLQGAIWLLDEPTPWNGAALAGVPAVTPMMTRMASDATANYNGYSIPTGGWACVVFIPHNTDPGALAPTVQTMFIKVDP